MACNAGHQGLIPGSGRSPGEGNGNPLQIPCLESPVNREAWQTIVHGSQRVVHNWVTNTFTFYKEEYNDVQYLTMYLNDIIVGFVELFKGL